jgi:threonyl-tRNA synthetase
MKNTEKSNDHDISIARHSLAHVLAYAVSELYPGVKLGTGPAIENGFYYDFDFTPLNAAISPENLQKIEKRMREILKQRLDFEKSDISIPEAKELFKDQPFKFELADDLEKQGNNKVSIYKTGKFTDLCSGPHAATTRDLAIEGFKLQRLAGAYWKGSEHNPMLTRIYGIAFRTAAELADFLAKEKEAQNRDHRVLGKRLDLFHIDEEVGLGLMLWHPKGALLWRIIEDFWYQKHLEKGYELVRSPHIGNRILWERSGHWGFFSENMYPPLEVGQSLEELKKKKTVADSEQYLLKPMNCPFHVRIYNNAPHSYRELPMRWAETGTVYRYEKKGELSGLTRVRGFTQDDAHIICRKDQVEKELKNVVDFILFMYKAFGFGIDSVNVYLSLRDPENKEHNAGNDAGWEFTESVLRKIAKEKKLKFKEDIGEAAFYGPKLDFKIKDALGREWQCSTLQFDFNLPDRFNMSFINAKGEKEQPYMLHRALFGSFERFIGLLIEHYSGNLPLWLAPVQVAVLPVGKAHHKYAKQLMKELKENNFRALLLDGNDSVGKKIREGETQKINYLLIVGDKEVKSKSVSVRRPVKGDIGAVKFKKFLENIELMIQKKK